MEVIIPAAGLSTRFPGMKPKYLLFDYKHDMMLANVVAPYLADHNVTVGILKEHDLKYNASLYIRNELPSVRVVVLDKPTRGPADTVRQILDHIDYDPASGLLIKDCDSFFDHEITDGSYVCTSNISDHEVLKKLASKSFVKFNDQGVISSIIEKCVVSNTFCVGGYKFAQVRDFIKAFDELPARTSEIFVSHVIQQSMFSGNVFTNKGVTNYVDVGTAEDWFDFNDRPVIFCDIDGTIVKAQGRYGENNFDDPPIILKKNVERLHELKKKGATIIFTTARPMKYSEQVIKLLVDLGFNSQCLIGLPSSRRILINDYNESNPFPRAEAINIYRDSDNLKDFL